MDPSRQPHPEWAVLPSPLTVPLPPHPPPGWRFPATHCCPLGRRNVVSSGCRRGVRRRRRIRAGASAARGGLGEAQARRRKFQAGWGGFAVASASRQGPPVVVETSPPRPRSRAGARAACLGRTDGAARRPPRESRRKNRPTRWLCPGPPARPRPPARRSPSDLVARVRVVSSKVVYGRRRPACGGRYRAGHGADLAGPSGWRPGSESTSRSRRVPRSISGREPSPRRCAYPAAASLVEPGSVGVDEAWSPSATSSRVSLIAWNAGDAHAYGQEFTETAAYPSSSPTPSSAVTRSKGTTSGADEVANREPA